MMRVLKFSGLSKLRLTACLSAILAIAAGCATAPDPMYQGPGAGGRLIYQAGVGITRVGAIGDANEQTLFAAAETAFSQRRWQPCVEIATTLIDGFPEGSRAVDAYILRIRANLEAGRVDASRGFGKTVTIDQWLFLYLAAEHDERLVALLRRDTQTRDTVREVRSLSIGAFLEKLSGDAFPMYNTGRLAAARFDSQRLLTYYLPALYLREYRLRVVELARDICWLMFAAEDHNFSIVLGEELLAVNPPPAVKGDTLLVMAHAQARNGAAPIAANTYGLLYRGAGLRDTDTRWRPHALLNQIRQTIATSKGYIYDVTYYERALELLGEYELYRLENPNISPQLNNDFIEQVELVYDVLARRDRNAADQYGKFSEPAAKQYYLDLADERDVQRAKRIKALQEAP